MYTSLLRDKALKTMIAKHVQVAQQTSTTYHFETLEKPTTHHCHEYKSHDDHHHQQVTQQYGSFCLRLGTVGFGAFSLVFTGLQIGAEMANGPSLRAIIPAARLLLVTAQMHFIFLNSEDLELTRHQALAKLGLMHMITCNVCEWLQVSEKKKKGFFIEANISRTIDVFYYAGAG